MAGRVALGRENLKKRRVDGDWYAKAADNPDPQFYYTPADGDFFDWLEKWNLEHKVDLIDEKDVVIPVLPKLGIANPFVLPRILSGARVLWSKKNSRQFNDDLLSAVKTYQAFDTECPDSMKVETYEDIFDPKKSPLFKPLIRDALAATYGSVGLKANVAHALSKIQVSGNVVFHPGSQMPGVGKPGTRAHDRSGSGPAPEVGAGENPAIPYRGPDKYESACQDLRPNLSGTPPAQGLPCPMVVGAKTRDQLANDPMQGICPNCYFLAALYSASMRYFNAFPPTLAPDTKGFYSISFYKETDLSKQTQMVKSTYPLTTAGHMVFAQQTPQFELWAAIYEKAYAKFKGYGQSPLPGAEAGDPNIAEFSQGDPMLSLTHITKLLYDEGNKNIANHPSMYRLPLTNPDLYGATSYDTLNSYDSAVCRDPLHHITLYPTVAWIIDVRGDDPGLYNNPAIVRFHAYSILGLFCGMDGGTQKNYIVLRNPWANRIDKTDPALVAVKDYLASGTWTSPDASFSVTFGAKADGIFGLEQSKFDALFAGFGWVQFSKAQIYS